MEFSPFKSVLVDRSNIDTLREAIKQVIGNVPLVGLDIETHDDNRHEGLNQLMRVDPITRKKSSTTKLLFDHRRTTVCGLSLYPDGTDVAFYFNLGHSDVANRLTWPEVKEILDAKAPQARWVIHNASFEKTMLGASVDYEVTNFICTLQMAVSAYGPDEYDLQAFANARFEPLVPLMREMIRVAQDYEYGKSMTGPQAELFAKITGKQSDADHSYNGLIKSIAWGYGLKKAVKAWFGYDMPTFEETLGGAAHMGQVSGKDVARYGCEDAVWAVRLYHRLLKYMLETNPSVVSAYFQQELPAIDVYSAMKCGGWVIDLEAVKERRIVERGETAKQLRALKAAVRKLLPFDEDPNEVLADREKWYVKHYVGKRKLIAEWANKPDADNDLVELGRIKGSVAKAWADNIDSCDDADDDGGAGLNLTHYFIARVLMYDLCRTKPVIVKGKVTSDGNARGKLVERFTKVVNELNANKPKGEDYAEGSMEAYELHLAQSKLDVMACLTELSGTEQRSKLYIEPYLKLCDPETHKVYPLISSLLASRRLSQSDPNGQQLAKRGGSTYVRGFFRADNKRQVLISKDWSAIELVGIAQESQDPAFLTCYSEIPYKDLHSITAANLLGFPSLQSYKDIVHLPSDCYDYDGVLFRDAQGKLLSGKDFYKWSRTMVGKTSNFGYWYSGGLSDTAEKLGWSSDQMWQAVEAFRETFPVAERWRLETIDYVKEYGFVYVSDGHRRVRFEATQSWERAFRRKFDIYLSDKGPSAFFGQICRNIQRRAGNQAVNTKIQGLCAALMKRTLVRLHNEAKARGYFRLVSTIHDEVVASVDVDHVLDYHHLANQIMCDHKELFPDIALHNTTSIGNTFEPFDKVKAPYGQIEIDEAPRVDWLPEQYHGQVLDDENILKVVHYLGGQYA